MISLTPEMIKNVNFIRPVPFYGDFRNYIIETATNIGKIVVQ